MRETLKDLNLPLMHDTSGVSIADFWKIMGLKVNDEDMEQSVDHGEELTTEQLQDLHLEV